MLIYFSRNYLLATSCGPGVVLDIVNIKMNDYSCLQAVHSPMEELENRQRTVSRAQ